MPASRTFAFGTIGVNHGHIYGQTEVMIDAGCRLKSFLPPEDDLAAAYGAKPIPDAKRVADERAILEDPEIRLVVGAGILADRAPMAVRAMRHGKDVMLDKPGATTLEQLAELRRAQAETGRILSILYSEHYTQPRDRRRRRAGQGRARSAACCRRSGSGRTGSATTTGRTGSGSRERTGGILTDIGSHQVEQFLFFTGSETAEDRRQPGRQFRPSGQAGVRGFRRHRCSARRTRDRLHPRRLVHAGRAADLGRRAALHPRHGRHDRAPEIYRHRRPAGRRSPLPRRPQGHAPRRLLRQRRSPTASSCATTCSTAPRRRCRRRIASCAMELALKAQAQATRIAGSAARREGRMTRRFKVGVVGGGVGVNHIEAYQRAARPLFGRGALRHRCRRGRRRSRRSTASPTVVTDFDELLDARSRHRQHLHALGAALRAGDARRCSPAATSWWKSRSPARSPRPTRWPSWSGKSGKRALPDLPVPLRRRHRAAPASARRAASSARPMSRRSRRIGGGCRPTTTIPGAAAGRRELGGCLITHAIHNHDMLTYVLGPVAQRLRPHGDARESDRDGGLRRRGARDGRRLVRHALGHARRRGGHVAAALLLRGADGGEQPQPLQSRHRAVALHRRRSGAPAGDRRGGRRSRRPARSAMPASSCGSTRR